jgi:uroporphyrinogen decarboxylase
MTTEAATFASLRVVAFESRRAEEIARMIAKKDGRPFVSPSMREVPLAHNQAAIDFANRLVTGQIDVVIFLTGVGTRHLVAQVERHLDRDRFLAAISDVKSVVRGPKPLAALKELGITPTIIVPEPNTWRELLTTLDERLPVANLVVGLQEYGVTNPSLIAGLEARGATVERVHVYDWDLPEDTAPLEENTRRIAAGKFSTCSRLPTTSALPRNCAPDCAAPSSPRSGRPRAKCSAPTLCRSTWNHRIRRWATSSRKLPNVPVTY